MEDSSESLTIAKMVSLPRLKVFDQELTAFEETYEYTNKYPVVDKNTYVGIEIETENVNTYRHESPYWTMIEDGSLRNNGREFITPPIRAWRVERALAYLFDRELNSDIEFTERTSVHIHMNVRTLTVPQLEALIITYLVFEKVLFNFIGNDRYNNIFCVPIIETDIGENLLSLITNKHPDISWQKYTALNLVPIMHKGTIEFRHMNGTKDIKHLITWINLILSLKKFALQKSPEYIWTRVNTLNTTSEYRLFAEEVFGEYIQLLWNDSFNSSVADCITYVKQFCIRNPFRIELRHEFLTQSTETRTQEGQRPEFEDLFDDEEIQPEPWPEPTRITNPTIAQTRGTDIPSTGRAFFTGLTETNTWWPANTFENALNSELEMRNQTLTERLIREQQIANNQARATETVRNIGRQAVRPTRVRI